MEAQARVGWAVLVVAESRQDASVPVPSRYRMLPPTKGLIPHVGSGLIDQKEPVLIPLWPLSYSTFLEE